MENVPTIKKKTAALMMILLENHMDWLKQVEADSEEDFIKEDCRQAYKEDAEALDDIKNFLFNKQN